MTWEVACESTSAAIHPPTRRVRIAWLIPRVIVLLLAVASLAVPRHAWAADETYADLNQRGNKAMRAGDYRQALDAWTRALAVADNTANKPALLNHLALVNKKLMRYDDAEHYYKMVIALVEPNADKDPKGLAIVLDNLGNMYDDQGKAAEGEKVHRRALALFEKVGGPDDIDALLCLNNIAQTLTAQKKYDEALAIFPRVIAGMEKAGDTVNLAIALDNEGLVYFRLGKFEDAEPIRKRALDLFEKALGTNHPEVGICAYNLGVTYFKLGKFAEAEPYMKQSVAITEATYGPKHRALIRPLRDYAALLEKLNRPDEAGALKKRADAIAEQK